MMRVRLLVNTLLTGVVTLIYLSASSDLQNVLDRFEKNEGKVLHLGLKAQRIVDLWSMLQDNEANHIAALRRLVTRN